MLQEIDEAVCFISSYLYNKLPRRRVDELVEFLKLEMKAAFRLHWHPKNPELGTAYRCLLFDESLDPLVVRCARNSGIPENEILASLPRDLYVWVDPGLVSYRTGDTGRVHYLFPASEASHTERPLARSATSRRLHCNRPFTPDSKFGCSGKTIGEAKLFWPKMLQHSNAEDARLFHSSWQYQRVPRAVSFSCEPGSRTTCLLTDRGRNADVYLMDKSASVYNQTTTSRRTSASNTVVPPTSVRACASSPSNPTLS